MATIAELLVRFGADITGFTAGAAAVQQALGSMGNQASQVGQGSFAGNLVGGIKSSYDSFIHFGEGVAHAAESITEMNFPLMNMIQGLVHSDAEMEQTNIAFTTLLHSSKNAGDYLKELWNFAAKTPFQFRDLAQASQQMIATGFSAKQTIPDLNSMGNALSAMGRTSAGDLMQLVSIFDRMEAGTKVNARDMQELTFMGINGWGMVAKAMGLSVTQVQNLSMHGKLLAKDVIPDLLNGFNKTFGGAMQAQALTFNGLLTTVKDNLQAAWRTISGPLFEAAKKALEFFGNLVASVNFSNLASGIAKAISGIFDIIGKVGGFFAKAFQGLDISPVMEAVQNVISVFRMAGDFLSSFFNNITKGGAAFQPLIAGVHGLLQSGLNTLGQVFQQIYVVLSAVFTGILAGQGPLGFLQGAFKQIASIVGGQLSQDFKTFMGVAKELQNWFGTTMMPILKQFIPPIISVGQTFFTSVLPALAQLWAIGRQVSNNLLPIVVHLFEFLAPILLRVGVALMQGIAIAFRVLGPIIQGVVTAIGGLINFFTRTEVGSAILKATLITLAIPLGILAIGFTVLAVQAVAAFIAGIPAMVGGFIAGAAGAWSMAAGVIALTWPILAVIAVIALIILAIMHWAQIVDFFKKVWAVIVSFLASVFSTIGSAIGNFFSALGTKVHDGLNAIGQFFVDVWNGIISGLKAAWDFILNAVKLYLTILLNIWTFPFRAIGALFEWLYQHNYYFQALVDKINSIVKGFLTWLMNIWNLNLKALALAWQLLSTTAQNVWNAMTSWITNAVNTVVTWITNAWNLEVKGLQIIWATISSDVQNAWNAIYNFFSRIISNITSFISSKWATISGWLQTQWNKISGFAQTAWNNVVSVFSGVWGKISSTLSGLWNNISNWFSNLAKTATTWGVNLIQQFINGILSMVNNVGAAVGQIINQIAKLLGFHSPTEEGPGRESDTWAPNLIRMFSTGLKKGVPEIQAAFNALVSPMAVVNNTIAQSTPYAGNSPSNQPVELHTHVYLDGTEITHTIGQNVINMIRSQGPVVSSTRGF